jgi:D-glycero-D-manno-heptose 1,7-bisphosphate phosphatase
MTDLRRAAFLDRDGTLIEDENYLADAHRMRLLPASGAIVRELNQREILVIVITNQSGIAQGLLTEAQYEATRVRLDALMKASGARIDATFHCPHYPSVSGPCDCRKPGTLLYERAAKQFGIDFRKSFFAGDRFRDVEPGLSLGGFARLVPSGSTTDEDLTAARDRALLAGSLEEAMNSYFKVHP